MNENERMAELLLPHIDKTPDYYETVYPPRALAAEARVTRIAPSPTGYLHLGTLFAALINRITADASGGIFYTRVEDTDKKREVTGGVEDIIEGLARFGIGIDEGFVSGDRQTGDYGPYRQSSRAEIYGAYAKELIRQGLAYPCFCTSEELDALRAQQEVEKQRTGYYGKWAKHRDISYDEAKALIDAGRPFVVRLRSPGSETNRIVFEDVIKGKIEMPENDEDFVLLKSDGIPTYHFAHAVDDHLMRTTHVLRGDEWISSVPKHQQLFKLLGFKPPKYGHISPIMKLDNGAKRKISKRKDPEAAVRYFAEQGYEPDSVIEYLMTIASSEFENWRRANPTADRKNFRFNLKKMSVSGALFDGDKLTDVGKQRIAALSADEAYARLTSWAEEFDAELYALLTTDEAYTKAVLSIDRGGPKPRRDIAKWSDARDYLSYFYEPLYHPEHTLPEGMDPQDAIAFLTAYKEVYAAEDDRQEWFGRIKSLCPELGFAAETKEYKANPEGYKGSAGDLSTVLRIAVTGRRNTPDLCSIMQILGKARCMERIDRMINALQG